MKCRFFRVISQFRTFNYQFNLTQRNGFFLKCEWNVEFPAFGIPATSVQAFGGFNTTTTSASAGLGGANFGGFGTAAPVSSGKVLYKEKITLVI